jgi:hypothetical protein
MPITHRNITLKDFSLIPRINDWEDFFEHQLYFVLGVSIENRHRKNESDKRNRK